MSTVTIAGPGIVVTAFADGQVLERAGVAWEGERVVGVGPMSKLVRAFPGAARLDVRDGLILPGLINLHHHFYSALARGLDPGRPLATFGEVLEGLWWRFDRALGPETVRLSAALSAAECIASGCTTVFDHHSSPSCLHGSLDLVAAAVREAGIAAVLCYEASDRNGHREALTGLKETLDFASRHCDDPHLRGMVGLHASFTVADSTLRSAARRRPAGTGVHLHVAEGRLDVDASRQSYGAHPVERLVTAGLLDQNALLAHGVHLDRRALEAVAAAGAVIVHNPESNANNGVGRLDVAGAVRLGCAVGLGTDGMSSSILRSLRAAFLGARAGARDPSAGFEAVPSLLATNAAFAARVFGEPLLGTLEVGAPADLTVLGGKPPTPVTAGNLFSHLVYGAAEGPVCHTVARGRVLLRDFRHVTLDPTSLAHLARQATPTLWQRFQSL
ncbi:MAG: amidohydrolase family protein [Acidobacteria bacterium]|nr:amidohydrolase family protein [Acidobacteriota bacterium]